MLIQYDLSSLSKENDHRCSVSAGHFESAIHPVIPHRILFRSRSSFIYHGQAILAASQCRMGISCDFLTIYNDLYKTYLWGICVTLNLFVALTSASESIYDVINMAAI